MYERNLRVLREWYSQDSEEYIAHVELRVDARRAGAREEALDSFQHPLARKLTSMELLARYNNRPRLTLGRRRGKHHA